MNLSLDNNSISVEGSDKSRDSSLADFKKQVHEIIEHRTQKEQNVHVQRKEIGQPMKVIGPYLNLLPRRSAQSMVRISPPSDSGSLAAYGFMNALNDNPDQAP